MASIHYDDVIMGAIASLITSLTIVYSTVYSDADQRKHQSSASLAFVRGIHRGPVNSPHKWPVTRKMFPFDDVIMSAAERGKATQSGFDVTNTHTTIIYPSNQSSLDILVLYVSLCTTPGHVFIHHGDVIQWKHFPRHWAFVGEFTGHQWIPLTKPLTRSFDVFFDLRLNKRSSKQ